MAVKDRTTKAANITVAAREQDFVTVFGDNWEALRNILGIMRPIRKAPGTKLVASKASVTLQSGAVDEGDEIPYSLATVEPVAFSDIAMKKYSKGVSIEAVAKFGAAVAIQKTDEAFLNELQSVVLTDFYTFLKTGALTNIETTFQMGLAMAKALVIDKFQNIRKSVSDVVGFVNVLDAYEYLGAANITVQTSHGINYIQNFMGYSTLLLLGANDIPRDTIIACPVENIDLYYIDPADSDFAQLGLEYTVQGETNLIGFHAEGNYSHAVGESYALMGMTLWAEYLDGIAVVKVEASGSIGSISGFSTASGGSAGKSQLTVPDPDVSGGTFWFKSQASTAPAAPTYLAQFDTTGYTKVEDDDIVTATNNHKYRVVEINGSGQVIATADGTVTAGT